MVKVSLALAKAVFFLAIVSPAICQESVAMLQTVPRLELLDEYSALVTGDDLYSSGGERLTSVWELLEQDRANYHIGVRQPGDTGDTFFATDKNRAKLEAMIAAGGMRPQDAEAIKKGRAFIRVQVWGHGTTGDYVLVKVE